MKTTRCCIFFFLLASCSSSYIPSSKNVPLFEKKGEIQMEAGASTNSLYLTGSYAFSEKYAVIANGSVSYPALAGKPIRGYNELTIFTDGDVPHHFFEMGIGRYNLLSSSKRRLEVFAGSGYGMAYDYFSKDYKSHYFQGFMQVNAGKIYNHVEIGWSLRTVYTGFKYQYGYYISGSYPNEYIIKHANYHALYIEPLFVIRVGGQHLRWFAKSGFNLGIPLSSFSNSIDHTIFHISTGVSFRF